MTLKTRLSILLLSTPVLIFVVVGTVSTFGFRLTRRLEEIGS